MWSNGLRYLRWGGDGEAVQPEKGYGVENCLGCAQNPQRQVHALLACGILLLNIYLKIFSIFFLVAVEMAINTQYQFILFVCS